MKKFVYLCCSEDQSTSMNNNGRAVGLKNLVYKTDTCELAIDYFLLDKIKKKKKYPNNILFNWITNAFFVEKSIVWLLEYILYYTG